MISTIDIKNIDTLPLNNLAILKDDFSYVDIYSLCLKIDKLTNADFQFKIVFKTINNIPFCILMIKNNNKIYKCFIDLTKANDFFFLKNLMKLETFNLYIILDNDKQYIFKITNSNNTDFVDALTAIGESTIFGNIYIHENAKQNLFDNFSDKELWNL